MSPLMVLSTYKPNNPKDEARNASAWHQNSSWGIDENLPESDRYVADSDDIKNCESISDIHIKRFKSKEVVVIKDSELDRFRRADDSSTTQSGKIAPRLLRRRTPTVIERDNAEGNFTGDEENTNKSDILEDKEEWWNGRQKQIQDTTRLDSV